MKYIHHPALGIVAFENHITHEDMVKALHLSPDQILGAGFIGRFSVDEDTLSCFGESVTLHRTAKQEDTNALRRTLRQIS